MPADHLGEPGGRDPFGGGRTAAPATAEQHSRRSRTAPHLGALPHRSRDDSSIGRLRRRVTALILRRGRTGLAGEIRAASPAVMRGRQLPDRRTFIPVAQAGETPGTVGDFVLLGAVSRRAIVGAQVDEHRGRFDPHGWMGLSLPAGNRFATNVAIHDDQTTNATRNDRRAQGSSSRGTLRPARLLLLVAGAFESRSVAVYPGGVVRDVRIAAVEVRSFRVPAQGPVAPVALVALGVPVVLVRCGIVSYVATRAILFR